MATTNNSQIVGEYGGLLSTKNIFIPCLLWVDKPFRGQGIGEQLVRTVFSEVKKRGVNEVVGPIESPYALHIRRRVLGEAALSFLARGRDAGLGDDVHIPLPATFDQMVDSLTRTEAYEVDLEERKHGIIVRADLSNFEL